MSLLQDPEYLRNDQYRTPDNLNARINLHERYSTNDYGWFKWVFDQFNFEEESRILELGCGPGDLWLENYKRISSHCEVTLSDFSDGMVAKSKGRCEEINYPFNFSVVDAVSIPLGDDSLDAVIANHCVYHFSDRQKAFSEIKRVLKPGGAFYSSTVGEGHLREIDQLVGKSSVYIEDTFEREGIPFTLEDGTDQLHEWFPKVKLIRYPDSLVVTEPEALVDFVLSTSRFGLNEEQRKEFSYLISSEIQSNGGTIHISKDSGMFISMKE